ncbi:effector-associated constant component EACC1 [Streptomyces mirabilis]
MEIAGKHSSDELRSLREWLIADESLRGRVRSLWA